MTYARDFDRGAIWGRAARTCAARDVLSVFKLLMQRCRISPVDAISHRVGCACCVELF